MCDKEIEYQLENAKAGIRQIGHRITSHPAPGLEAQFTDDLEAVLDRLDCNLESINERYNTRGRSKRALGILHKHMPEPAWGVHL